MPNTTGSIFQRFTSIAEICSALGLSSEYATSSHRVKGCYRVFHIRKRRSGQRIITAPIGPIKTIQYQIYRYILAETINRNALRNCAHGFVPGRSIITNAKQHVGNRIIFNIDLKDFFPTITQNRISGLFRAEPFGASRVVAEWLASMCCYEGCLPQGAPTSPFLSNLICFKLDRQLQYLAKTNFCVYTRYADDITFSKRSGEIPQEIASMDPTKTYVVGTSAKKIIENGFQINTDKVHLYRKIQRQTVTGIVVNSKLNVHREFIRNIRAMIYDCQKNGYERALKNHEKYYRHKDRNGGIPPILKIIEGKLDFLGMVRGTNDPVRRKLQGRLLKIYPEYNKQIMREMMDIDKKDFFICHASEDKDEFVRPFASALICEGLSVWYDEFDLENMIGRSLMDSI